jgi:hypothetical protein
MTVPAALIDPFHRELHRVLTEDIITRTAALASGSAHDYASYRYQVGQIEMLHSVLDKCQELEQQRYGGRPSD